MNSGRTWGRLDFVLENIDSVMTKLNCTTDNTVRPGNDASDIIGSGNEWLAAYLAPSHYLIQWWLFVNWTLSNKFQQNLQHHNTSIFLQENAFKNVCAIRPFCSGLNVIWLRHHQGSTTSADKSTLTSLPLWISGKRSILSKLTFLVPWARGAPAPGRPQKWSNENWNMKDLWLSIKTITAEI